MTHVFVVNDNTFNYHLKYMFAGTGASDKEAEFLIDPLTLNIHSTTERNLVGMIADISRIRENDKILFYLIGCAKFYGVFRVKRIAFYDKKDGNYLSSELQKLLIFRILIEPDKVFSDGVTEHEVLDVLDGINNPYEMCWSLIYRKLKGNRGCTMIFDYESNRIESLIKSKNRNNFLEGKNFSFDNINNKIILSNDSNKYNGPFYSIDIKNRLLYKAKNNNAYEVHLQAYIMQNFDKSPLNLYLFDQSATSKWIGNEVSCGVGMQRIDIMTVSENEKDVYIKIIELKHIEPYPEIVNIQLKWYVKWCNDYIVPNFNNKNVYLEPIVFAKDIQNYNDFYSLCLNEKYHVENAKISPIQYIGFCIENEQIKIKKIF